MATRYKLNKDMLDMDGNTIMPVTAIIKIDDNGIISSIPKDEANTDYQEYLAWVAEGNTAEEAD